MDGTIVVDYPPEECEEFSQKMQAKGMDPIFLLAPTSSEERIRQVAAVSSGFDTLVAGSVLVALAGGLALLRFLPRLPFGRRLVLEAEMRE